MQHTWFKSASKGIASAFLAFVVLGTVSSLWDNPFFIRMTPAGNFEVILLFIMSVLLGYYVVIRRPFCSMKMAGSGGVLGFIGIACPVCNKVLLLLFGGEVLLIYFEPVRIYVALAGTIIVAITLLWEWKIQRTPETKILVRAS